MDHKQSTDHVDPMEAITTTKTIGYMHRSEQSTKQMIASETTKTPDSKPIDLLSEMEMLNQDKLLMKVVNELGVQANELAGVFLRDPDADPRRGHHSS